MAKYSWIIFLDEEGTGLSPYAKVLLDWKMRSRGIEGIMTIARGNVVLFSEPANQKITELARLRGLSLTDYKSAEMDGTEFSDDTLILTFNADVKQQVYDRFPNAFNVYMLREFLGETGEILLPLGGSLEEYDAVCAVVDRVTDKLLEKLLYEDDNVEIEYIE